jgi:hypothetical protein
MRPKYLLSCTAKIKCQKFETNIPRKGIPGLSPNFYIHASVNELYIPMMGMPFFAGGNMWTDPGTI